MGIAQRISELYQAKVNSLLDWAEDPQDMLDYSYAQQEEFLRRIRAGVADVAASREHARMQEAELRCNADRLGVQAEQAVAAGRDELGRDALRLRAEMVAHADDLAAGQPKLRAEEQRLTAAAQRLRARVEVFRYRKEALKAAYTAAEVAAAQRSAGRFWDERDIAEASCRAEDQTMALRARAEALGEQLESDMSEVAAPLNAERIQQQLDAVSTQAAVEEELARIKKRLASSGAQHATGRPHAAGS
jgi:phage shock protein A